MNSRRKIELLYSMLKIRRVQERIEAFYVQDEMKTPVHLCIGQEAIAAGVCAALNKEDYISSNHRGHGHYLAKGGDLNAMISELHCKVTGCSKGRGGSMHLVDISVGHMGSSSIVGGGIPIATGLALSIQMKKESRVSVVFFGDGASDEGVLYESINFAMLKKLPVIYIYENNQWSVCSNVASRKPSQNVFHACPTELLWTRMIDGNDVLKVYEAAEQAVRRAREGQGPSLIECETYRILGHAGCAAQEPGGYRDPQEVQVWRERCPVKRYQQHIFSEGTLSQNELASIEKKIQAEIDEAFVFARTSPTPEKQDLHKYLFKE